MDQTPQRPSPDANPLRLATATIRAVDRIGLAACNEIGQTADEVVRGAHEVADHLRTLVIAIQEHSTIASDHVSDFCNRATLVLEGVRNLQAKLLTGEQPVEANGTEASKVEDINPSLKVIRTERPDRQERELPARRADQRRV
jgi:hypothetical protein